MKFRTGELMAMGDRSIYAALSNLATFAEEHAGGAILLTRQIRHQIDAALSTARIIAVCGELRALAERSRRSAVSVLEFEELLSDMHHQQFYPHGDLVAAVTQAFHRRGVCGNRLAGGDAVITVDQLTADWWESLAKLKADILAANGKEAIIDAACKAEQARAEFLLQAIEDAGRMTPAEAAGLLDLALVLFADEDHEDDHLFRLLSAIRDGLAPPM